ncbi:hypothetical protein M2165_000646 [Variovorax sp. TBS-050B]|uniref:aromatic-ring-hydroxylating dioxygenase subunit beta n=1 Tax=Variovorax sp. TBS-050B TaxID=2940551 RepID=UPI0024753178|nr:aromatic-ring-hydroxylating dioxygenase subunit beta [Variovorax sp. TBS-050B]MDH6590757.1 hypothetical protein [Variovorax sp. TBS-050B]
MNGDPRDFAAHEAALLDGRRFDEWLALFAEDGRYWVPLLGAAQADPFSHNSLAFEDRLLLQLRVERLKNPRAHSQHPMSHCQHVLQASRIEQEEGEGGEVRLRTPFVYVESRGGGATAAERHGAPPPRAHRRGLGHPREAHRPARPRAGLAGDPAVHLSIPPFLPPLFLITGATT